MSTTRVTITVAVEAATSLDVERLRATVASAARDAAEGFPDVTDAWTEMSSASERGSRPSRADVPSTTGDCPVHGVTEFRVHKIGRRRGGVQRFRSRCLLCHAAAIAARRSAAEVE